MCGVALTSKGTISNRFGVANEEAEFHKYLWVCRGVREPWPEFSAAWKHSTTTDARAGTEFAWPLEELANQGEVLRQSIEMAYREQNA